MSKKLQIHNSTAEFLIFQLEDKEEGVQVLYQDETIWATQDAIAMLFDKGRSTIAEHLQHVFQIQELLLMVNPMRLNTIIWTLLSLSATVSILFVLPSFVSGVPMYFASLPFVDM